MTREEAKALLPVIQAWVEGKVIERRFKLDPKDPWTDLMTADLSFTTEDWEYRIKKEPKYRPFKDAEECWREMKKHQPFGWVKSKTDDGTAFYDQVGSLYFDDEEKEWVKTSICSPDSETMKESLENYTFADGTPFGVLEENV